MKYTDRVTATSKMFLPGDENIFDYYKRNNCSFGNINIFVHYGKNHDRDEFYADIEAMSAYFSEELGLKRGDVFTVFMPTNPESLIILYALNRIGVITALVHPMTPPDALVKTMKFTKSKGVALLDMFLPNFAAAIAGMNVPCLVCVPATYAYPVKYAAPVNENAAAVMGSLPKADVYPLMLKKYEGKDASELSSRKDDVCVYMNGGGTTGVSKTIKLTNYNINWITWMTADDNNVLANPGVDTMVCCMPMFHAFGLAAGPLAGLHEGAKLAMLPKFDADQFTSIIKTEQVYEFNGVPNMYKKLISHPDFDGPHLARIKTIYCGGDALSKAEIAKLKEILRRNGSQAEVCQGYGLTECCAVNTVNRPWDNKPGSIGVPQRFETVEIWDEDGRRLANGEIGEITITGPNVMQGYLTEDGPVDEGVYYDGKGGRWIRTGDLGYMDDDGFVFFVGRKKRVVIISGYNVYPRDIETLLTEFPEIRESCAVQGYQGSSPIVRLFVVLNDPDTDKEALEAKIASVCREKISQFAVPREIRYLDALPRTKMEKIDFMSLSQFKPE